MTIWSHPPEPEEELSGRRKLVAWALAVVVGWGVVFALAGLLR